MLPLLLMISKTPSMTLNKDALKLEHAVIVNYSISIELGFYAAFVLLASRLSLLDLMVFVTEMYSEVC